MDSVIHGLVGLLVGGAVGIWVPGHSAFVAIGLGAGFAVFGVAREWWQHWDDDPRLTPHRWLEGVSWGLGGFIGGCL